MHPLSDRSSFKSIVILVAGLFMASSGFVSIDAGASTNVTHSGAGPSSSVQVNPIAEAINKLMTLAEEGEQLKDLRESLQAKLENAQTKLAVAKRNPPGSDARDEVKDAYNRGVALAEVPVDAAEADLTRFDTQTLPAFKARVDSAIKDLEDAQTAAQASAEDRTRAKGATDKIDAALTAIRAAQSRVQIKTAAPARPTAPTAPSTIKNPIPPRPR